MSDDTELFELCKEVYKQTGWYDEKSSTYANYDLDNGEPLTVYTSDYLIEKLPESLPNVEFNFTWRLNIKKGLGGYVVDYSNEMWVRDHKSYFTRIGYDAESITYWSSRGPIYSDTLVKALLKLVIALDDAGAILDGSDKR